ncbi:hypothetical protein [Methanosarcina barkeri]|nr:hypothetical protein [Methanosarcina barkeri]
MFYRHNDTNEIDIGATQWGWMYSDRLNYGVAPNSYQSAIPYDSPYQNATDVTYSFDWEPTYVHFTAKLSNGTVISDWNCTDQTSIPHVAGGVAMQMWLMNHLAPINGQNAEMVLSDFSYVPSSVAPDTPDAPDAPDTSDTYLNWCGREWWVRNVPGNPGGNNWSNSSNSVWVDENQNLHLTIQKIGDIWYSTEVDTTSTDYIYGVYTCTVSSPILNLDPNIVAGMFFRHNDTNEIDIEATQWGGIYSDRLSYSVQPNAYQSAIPYDSPYQNATDVTYSFDWEPTYVHFTTKLSNGTVISDWNCTDQTSIPHVTGGVAMQMWLMNHLAPINGQNAEMVLSNFSYVPS